MKEPLHLFLTRYNMPWSYPGFNPESPLDPDWLDHREQLFRHFCQPAVEGQSDDRFQWLLFFHHDTPKHRYKALAKRHHVHFARNRPDLIRIAQEIAAEHGGPVLTTRLDTDDTIARDFVRATRLAARAVLKAPATLGVPHAICWATGIEREPETGAIYTRDYPKNQIATLLETEHPIETAWGREHWVLPTFYASSIFRTPHPMWAITIHARNVVNQASKGELVTDESERQRLLDAFVGPKHIS
jgi:hypothetical protein